MGMGKKLRVYNGEDVAITVVTDENPNVVIPAKSFATIETDGEFGTDSFYVDEAGSWYATEAGHTGADLEIYNEG